MLMEQLWKFIASNPDVFLIFDGDGNLVRANNPARYYFDIQGSALPALNTIQGIGPCAPDFQAS